MNSAAERLAANEYPDKLALERASVQRAPHLVGDVATRDAIIDRLCEPTIMQSTSRGLLFKILQRAAHHYNVPVVLISFVHSSQLKFPVRLGLDVDHANYPQDGFNFCQYACERSIPTIILDAKSDSRFINNPLVVHPPNVRMYVGAPLQWDTMYIGTLCIIDSKPWSRFALQDGEVLCKLAAEVMQLLRQAADTRAAELSPEL
eukprot:CAMPEP_0119314072 /NCGR_PEP_ID=MMETSP1333-20130426/31560_1 /TAXON_ID=418940 /ORGANISM="Scyphosphaera apsteinii, Strain RCC1455" /LENGTH=203 /DNA_ID=CAMNT_0007319105 /DNA_START=151 /DNA_END=762 /DNA_ORIENTATION=-